MKTKLLAVIMMGIATIGTIGITAADENDYSDFNAGGFGSAKDTSGVGISGTGANQDGTLIDVIKRAINWILGMLSLITLVILLWGGFQMITAAGDDAKYKKGFTILKQAGIGLIFIGVSWLFITAIFRFIGGAGASGSEKENNEDLKKVATQQQ